MHYPVNVRLISGSNKVEDCPSVALKERLRVRNAPIDVSLCCKVHDYVSILHDSPSELIVGEVPFDEMITLVFANVLKTCMVASKTFVIDISDPEVLTRGSKQIMNEIASDKT